MNRQANEGQIKKGSESKHHTKKFIKYYVERAAQKSRSGFGEIHAQLLTRFAPRDKLVTGSKFYIRPRHDGKEKVYLEWTPGQINPTVKLDSRKTSKKNLDNEARVFVPKECGSHETHGDRHKKAEPDRSQPNTCPWQFENSSIKCQSTSTDVNDKGHENITVQTNLLPKCHEKSLSQEQRPIPTEYRKHATDVLDDEYFAQQRGMKYTQPSKHHVCGLPSLTCVSENISCGDCTDTNNVDEVRLGGTVRSMRVPNLLNTSDGNKSFSPLQSNANITHQANNITTNNYEDKPLGHPGRLPTLLEYPTHQTDTDTSANSRVGLDCVSSTIQTSEGENVFCAARLFCTSQMYENVSRRESSLQSIGAKTRKVPRRSNLKATGGKRSKSNQVIKTERKVDKVPVTSRTSLFEENYNLNSVQSVSLTSNQGPINDNHLVYDSFYGKRSAQPDVQTDVRRSIQKEHYLENECIEDCNYQGNFSDLLGSEINRSESFEEKRKKDGMLSSREDSSSDGDECNSCDSDFTDVYYLTPTEITSPPCLHKSYVYSDTQCPLTPSEVTLNSSPTPSEDDSNFNRPMARHCADSVKAYAALPPTGRKITEVSINRKPCVTQSSEFYARFPTTPNEENVQEDSYSNKEVRRSACSSANTDFLSFTVSEVAKCLEDCGMQELASICRKELLDGSFFIDSNCIAWDKWPFQLTKFHVLKLFKIINGWRPKKKSYM